MEISMQFECLLGQTIKKVIEDGYTVEFATTNSKYLMTHEQCSSEEVWLEDVTGDWDDVIGCPITLAEEVSGEFPLENSEDLEWTFYKLGTSKGSVTLRWGCYTDTYYSTDVSLLKIA